jgi:hypothetical protein
MRVMVIVKANEASEAGKLPSQELSTEMGQFNGELVTRDLIAGCWIWQIRCVEEAAEWIRRSPFFARARRRSKSDACSKPRTSATT